MGTLKGRLEENSVLEDKVKKQAVKIEKLEGRLRNSAIEAEDKVKKQAVTIEKLEGRLRNNAIEAEKKIREKVLFIEKLEEAVKEKEGLIETLDESNHRYRDKVQEQRNKLSEGWEALKAKDEEIERLKSLLEQRSDLLEGREALNDKDKEIESLKSLLMEKHCLVAELELFHKLDKIERKVMSCHF